MMRERDEFENLMENLLEGAEATPPRSVWEDVAPKLENGDFWSRNSVFFFMGFLFLVTMSIYGYANTYVRTEGGMHNSDSPYEGKIRRSGDPQQVGIPGESVGDSFAIDHQNGMIDSLDEREFILRDTMIEGEKLQLRKEME